MSVAQIPAPSPPPVLDQYKAYLQDLGNIGTRYATEKGFYLSVITALLGVLTAFGGAQSSLRIAVPVFAILVCLVWWESVGYYSRLFHAKFNVLREMEKQGQLFPIFERESFFLSEAKSRSVLKNDRNVPILMGFLFFVVVLVSLLRCLPA